jgi:hypothetical protein
MTDLTLEQIKAAVDRGLREVAEHFARDPRPTDGSIRGALAAFRKRRRKTKPRRDPPARSRA